MVRQDGDHMDYKRKMLINPLTDIEGFNEFLYKFQSTHKGKVVGTVDACKAHFIYSTSALIGQTPVIITPDEISARKLYDDLQYLYEETKVYLYPARDILFYNADVHSMDITAERMKIIEALLHEQEAILIIPAEALLNPLSPKETWLSYQKELKEGSIIDIKKLGTYLMEIGYERVGKVEGIGQFAIRGGIIDLYPPNSVMPYRIELWDDEIDSIRTFNPSTQRSIEKVKQILVVPNQEIIFPFTLLQNALPAIKEDLKVVTDKLRNEGKKESAKAIEEQVKEHIEQIQEGLTIEGLETYVPYTNLQTVSILDYLPADTIIYVDEPAKVRDKCDRLYEEYRSSMMDRLNYGHILSGQMEFIFEYEEAVYTIQKRPVISLNNFLKTDTDFETDNQLSIAVYENNTFYNSLDLLEKDIKEWKKSNKKIIILAGIRAKAMRLMEELEVRGILTTYSETLSDELQKGQVVITKGSLGKGFVYEGIDFYIIADKDLFGKEKKKQPIIEAGLKAQKRFNDILFQGISEDELKCWENILRQMSYNIIDGKEEI